MHTSDEVFNQRNAKQVFSVLCEVRADVVSGVCGNNFSGGDILKFIKSDFRNDNFARNSFQASMKIIFFSHCLLMVIPFEGHHWSL